MLGALERMQEFIWKDQLNDFTSPELTDFVPGTESLKADQDSVTLPSESPLVVNRASGTAIRFIYRKGIRRITLQRFLVTKLVKFPGTITLLELNALYDNMLWCLAKSESDPGFNQKFGETLEVIKRVLNKVRVGNQVRNIRRLSEELQKQNLESFLYPERNLPQIQKKLTETIYVLNGELGVPTNRIPPRNFIGKGYRDHGCLKDQAWDGSPSWQEVAMAHLDLLETINGTTTTDSSQNKN